MADEFGAIPEHLLQWKMTVFALLYWTEGRCNISQWRLENSEQIALVADEFGAILEAIGAHVSLGVGDSTKAMKRFVPWNQSDQNGCRFAGHYC